MKSHTNATSSWLVFAIAVLGLLALALEHQKWVLSAGQEVSQVSERLVDPYRPDDEWHHIEVSEQYLMEFCTDAGLSYDELMSADTSGKSAILEEVETTDEFWEHFGRVTRLTRERLCLEAGSGGVPIRGPAGGGAAG